MVIHTSSSSKIALQIQIQTYDFVDCVDDTKNINHTEDIIEMNNYYFESGSDISHSLTSPRIIGIVSDERADTITLYTYSEQMILDAMFPVMERTSYNNESSFFGLRFGIPFHADNGLWYARSITST